MIGQIEDALDAEGIDLSRFVIDWQQFFYLSERGKLRLHDGACPRSDALRAYLRHILKVRV
jgi:hypothetical protein